MERVTKKRLALYTGACHPALAEEIADHLDVELGDPGLITFANGEIRARYAESIRGTDVFIIQTHYGCDGRSINDAILEQLIMIDAAHRASAKRITAVCPFYGYSR
ncbi:MAG TPA: ribose-phosphate pyrophosphokinase-like domain-containing protein, partial [Acidimicrobiales bacterium]|nr:ribose-phosphate pyrophosphokinase-like domain-containing protein [Acidimicrobiales bacterium]